MYELANTSLPNGLIAGTHGFATVAMTKGLPDALRIRIESLCAYTHKSSSHDASYQTQNPVNWFHAILPQGEHVLGRVAASDFDYTGRTNRLARLLVFPSREMPAAGAAEVLSAEASRLSAPWSGEPRYLPEDKAAASRLAAIEPVIFAAPTNWTALLGANGADLARRFALLLERNVKSGGRPIYFKTSATFDQKGTKLLGLFSDLISLLPPELRAAVTFSTYPAAIPNGTKCLLLGAFEVDRNFAVAASTQPWVDCEKGVVNHADMLPVPSEKPKAAPVQSQTGPTLATVEAAEEPAPKKPLRLKQNEPSTQRQTKGNGSRGVYLPPPRYDNRSFGIYIAVCVGAILVFASATLLIWQDRANKKKAERARIANLAQKQREEAELMQSREFALVEYSNSVEKAVSKLDKLPHAIFETENPDHFEFGVLPASRREADDARVKARAKGVENEQLKPYDDKLETAVSRIKAAIKDRRDALDADRREAQPAVVLTDKLAATASSPKDSTAEPPSSTPADSHLAFYDAIKEVKVIGINELNNIVGKDKLIVFYYRDFAKTVLTNETATMKKGDDGDVTWSPNPQAIQKRSRGLFTLWYCDIDKTLYWLWDLKPEKTKGLWFSSATNDHDGTPVTVTLRTMVFGDNSDVYNLFENHLGSPKYRIEREKKPSGIIGGPKEIMLPDVMIAFESHITEKLFEPSEEEFKARRENLENKVAECKEALDVVKRKVEAENKKAADFEKNVDALEESLKQISSLKDNKKEDPKKFQEKMHNAEKAKEESITKVAEDSGKFGALSVSAYELERHDKPGEIVKLLKERKILDGNGKVPRKNVAEATKEAQKKLDNANTALRKCEENLKAEWRKIAQESSYAIAEVIGAKQQPKRGNSER